MGKITQHQKETKKKKTLFLALTKIAIASAHAHKREVSTHQCKWTRKNCSTQKKLINTLITLKAYR